jgi:hypothetical protein
MISIRPIRVALLSACILSAFAAQASLAAGCPAADAAARAALAAQQKVQQDSTSIPIGEEGDTDLSVPLQKSLHNFKQALADAVDARMACAGQSVDITALNRDLSATLQHKAVTPAASAKGPTYGNGLDIDAQLTDATSAGAAPSANAAAPLVLVRSGIGIACGTDNVVLGYRWDGAHWKRVLRWQSENVKNIADAYGFPIGIVPLHDGQVALLRGTPQCASRWGQVAIDVIAPAQGAAGQRSLFHTGHGYINEEETSFKPTADGFEMRAHVASLDTDLMERVGILRYRVAGDQVTRIQPAANNGRDFVDEWLQVDEPLAHAWSDPGAATQAVAERARLLATAKKESLGVSYGAVRSCSDHAARYQVELELATDTPAKAAPHFAVIQQARNGFTLMAFNPAADPQCRGADLMGSKGK